MKRRAPSRAPQTTRAASAAPQRQAPATGSGGPTSTSFLESQTKTADACLAFLARLRAALERHQPSYVEEEVEHPAMPTSPSSLSRTPSSEAPPPSPFFSHSQPDPHPHIPETHVVLGGGSSPGRAAGGGSTTATSSGTTKANLELVLDAASASRFAFNRVTARALVDAVIQLHRKIEQAEDGNSAWQGSGKQRASGDHPATTVAACRRELFAVLQSALVHCNASPVLTQVVTQSASLAVLLDVANAYHRARFAAQSSSQAATDGSSQSSSLSQRRRSAKTLHPHVKRERSSPSLIASLVDSAAATGGGTASSSFPAPVAPRSMRDHKAELDTVRSVLADKPFNQTLSAVLLDAYALEFLVDAAMPPAVCSSKFEVLQNAAWRRKADFVAAAGNVRGFSRAFLSTMPMRCALNLVVFALHGEPPVRIRFYDQLVADGLVGVLTNALRDGAAALAKEGAAATARAWGTASSRAKDTASCVEALDNASSALDVLLLLSAPAETPGSAADEEAVAERPRRVVRRAAEYESSSSSDDDDSSAARKKAAAAKKKAQQESGNSKPGSNSTARASNAKGKPAAAVPVPTHEDGTPVFGVMLLRTTATLAYSTSWATRPDSAALIDAVFAVLQAATAIRHAAASPRAYLAGILQDKAAQTLSQSAIFSTALLRQVVSCINSLVDAHHGHGSQHAKAKATAAPAERGRSTQRRPAGATTAASKFTVSDTRRVAASTPASRVASAASLRGRSPAQAPVAAGKRQPAVAPAGGGKSKAPRGSTSSPADEASTTASSRERWDRIRTLTVLLPVVQSIVTCISSIRENEALTAAVAAKPGVETLVDESIAEVAENMAGWCRAFCDVLDYSALEIGLVSEQQQQQRGRGARGGASNSKTQPPLRPLPGGRHLQRTLLPFFQFWQNMAPELRKSAAVAAATPVAGSSTAAKGRAGKKAFTAANTNEIVGGTQRPHQAATMVALTPAVERLGLAVKRCAVRLLQAHPTKSRVGRDNMVLTAARCVLRVEYDFSAVATPHDTSEASLLLRLKTHVDDDDAKNVGGDSPSTTGRVSVFSPGGSLHMLSAASESSITGGGDEPAVAAPSSSSSLPVRRRSSGTPPRMRLSAASEQGSSPGSSKASPQRSSPRSQGRASPPKKSPPRSPRASSREKTFRTPPSRDPQPQPAATTTTARAGGRSKGSGGGAAAAAKTPKADADTFSTAAIVDDLSPLPLTSSAVSVVAGGGGIQRSRVRSAARTGAASRQPASLAAAFKLSSASSSARASAVLPHLQDTPTPPADSRRQQQRKQRGVPGERVVADEDATSPGLTVGDLLNMDDTPTVPSNRSADSAATQQSKKKPTTAAAAAPRTNATQRANKVRAPRRSRSAGATAAASQRALQQPPPSPPPKKATATQETDSGDAAGLGGSSQSALSRVSSAVQGALARLTSFASRSRPSSMEPPRSPGAEPQRPSGPPSPGRVTTMLEGWL